MVIYPFENVCKMIDAKILQKQYTKIKPDKPSDKPSDKPFDHIIGNLLDELHDKIDLASWESARQDLFSPVADGWGLNVDKLKIEELDTLVFAPCEFELIRRLCLKDDYSLEHSLKAMAISLRVAQIFGLCLEDKLILAKGAALHDIGKASCDPDTQKEYIDDYILKSYYHDAAYEDEFLILKKHVQYGVRDLNAAYEKAGIDGSKIVDLVAKHHERLDGNGYPGGLKLSFDDILPQILAFADMVEAMTANQRPYQKTCSFDEIRTEFDTHLIGKFSDMILNLILDDETREIIEQEVEESRQATDKIFIDL